MEPNKFGTLDRCFHPPQLRRALEERLALDDLELWEISWHKKGQVFTLPEDPEE